MGWNGFQLSWRLVGEPSGGAGDQGGQEGLAGFAAGGAPRVWQVSRPGARR
jgi:hypothetical protein